MMKPTEKLNRLVFNMRSTVQKIGYIVISVIGTDRAGGKTSETGLAEICVEPGRFADYNCIDRANGKAGCTFGMPIL
jgi:hypothetical protein